MGVSAKVGQEGLEISLLARIWALIWEAAPGHTLAWAILLTAQAVLPVALVYLTKAVVDSLVAAIGAPGDPERSERALVTIGLAAGVMLASEILQSVADWIRSAQSELIQDHVKNVVHQQSVALDLAFYESPEYHDRLEQVRTEASSRPMTLLESVGSLVQNGITLVAMAAVLASYSFGLPVVLGLSALPALYVVLRFDRRYHGWWNLTTVQRRRAQYYDFILTHVATAPEVRLFGLGAHFHSAYQVVRRRLRSERLLQLRQQAAARLFAGGAGLLLLGATMAWMVWRALHGLFTLGDLALVYQALQRAQGLTRALLGNLSQVYTSTLFLAKLFAFLDLKAQIVDPPKPVGVPVTLEHGIAFRNVTFRYPGSERVALQDFNLTIRPNTIAAIVGPNGAGKSTLIKLLCRFYDPTAGRIEVDGTDIRRFTVEDLRRLMTLLFEFPVAYQASASENIALGDLPAAPSRLEIEAAARSAGAHEIIARLPQGYETQLGKWFSDGANLSGGEWQRIATARAFLRRSQIIVLDEPTSMVDSWAEADWFERVRTLARGRIALIITHRFTLAMRADVIHVMDDGRIVESGSHHDLLAAGGLYAQSWATQLSATRPAGRAATDGHASAPGIEITVPVAGSGDALGLRRSISWSRTRTTGTR